MLKFILGFILLTSTCLAQQLDSTFHFNGNHKLDLPNFASHASFSQPKLALQSSQKIILAGVLNDTSSLNESKIQVIRLTDDGFIDSTFGNLGVAILPLDTSYLHYTKKGVVIGIQSNDKIIIAANLLKPNSFHESTWMWARMNADGQLDTTFTNNGISYYPLPLGIPQYFTNTVILPNDEFLLINNVKTSKIVKLKSNGIIDSSFGINGFAANPSFTLNYSISKGIAQPDGKILLAGQTSTLPNYFYVSRLLPNGLVDSNFGINGAVTAKIDSNNIALSLALQDDGSILVAGRSSDTSNSNNNLCGEWIKAVLLRFTHDGTLDLSFHQTGYVIIDNPISIFYSEFSDVHLYNHDHILATGDYQTNGNQLGFMLANFKLDGNLETSFGNAGIIKTIETDSINWCYASQFQGSDKIILQGMSRHFMNFNGYKPMVARYRLDINLGFLQKEKSETGIFIYPNPIQQQANLRYSLIETDKISIQLFDMQGRLVQTFLTDQTQFAGEHQINLSFQSKLTTGQYLLQVHSAHFRKQIQLSILAP
ncbi:MAG TPA: T9SS type A sorting domain-containing protein [Chitinophagaceae bacterium]|nr:T9SS type A sorting domain-containing protein [Chitinophagaceae bacterium]